MAENLMNSDHKAVSPRYRRNYEEIKWDEIDENHPAADQKQADIEPIRIFVEKNSFSGRIQKG